MATSISLTTSSPLALPSILDRIRGRGHSVSSEPSYRMAGPRLVEAHDLTWESGKAGLHGREVDMFHLTNNGKLIRGFDSLTLNLSTVVPLRCR